MYFFNWHLPSSMTVIPNLWVSDPGGATRLSKRFGKSMCTQNIANKQSHVMNTHTRGRAC